MRTATVWTVANSETSWLAAPTQRQPGQRSRRFGGMLLTVVAAAAGSLYVGGVQAAQPAAGRVDFNRDIRPILSDTCYQCHGPDEAQRQADFRLDQQAVMYADRGGYRVVVPHDPAASELYRRIASPDADVRMPPPESGRRLTGRQIDLFKRWIEQGAEWQDHWSFIPPHRPEPPDVQRPEWCRSAIDRFILARLEGEGLSGSIEADKTTLIRRVTLDLTGLPPTPAEVDAFLADRSPDAYERVVDRLLASPHYGERMALVWLDAARYADTSGYQTDGERQMWRWRDWVIDAFNSNLPFDRFTVEQLAGDLLPDPTLDQLIATGFNRNHRANSEGGIVFEEYLVEYAVDRVDTTATVWLGLTMGCSRCHDHKYDPLTQKDFYALSAFFNNIPERGRVIKYGNSAPFIKAPTRDQRRELEELSRQLAAAESEVRGLEDALTHAQSEWEASFQPAGPVDWTSPDGLILHCAFDRETSDRSGQGKQVQFEGGEAGYVAGAGRATAAALRLDGGQAVEVEDLAPFVGERRFSCACWIYFDEPQNAALLSRMQPDSYEHGFAIELSGDRIRVSMGPRWLDDSIRIETENGLTPGRWNHLVMTYDASNMAEGVRVYVDGEQQPVRTLYDLLTGGFASAEPLRVGSRADEHYFHGVIDDVRCYDRELSAREVSILACPQRVDEIVAIPARERNSHQARKLRGYFLEHHAPDRIREAAERLHRLRGRKLKLWDEIPTTMIMQDRPEPRQTHVLVRGEYSRPGEPVSAGVPSCLPPLPSGAPRNRLGLAEWLVDPSHPLTSRVAVNRLWQIHFGDAPVRTAEDFGAQGAWPTHPDMLDWLATEYVRLGLDTKALQKRIVTSAAYRQSSQIEPEQIEVDPENRLLGRCSRIRLPGEFIRDQALAAGGLLTRTLGGPSVKPYQPPGLWEELASQTYNQDEGAKLYRRSIYTFWKRTVPPPLMTTFDGPARETCIVRRSRTDTPLQALALMNDVTFIEAARRLAERMMTEGGDTPDERIAYGFRLLLARAPSAEEQAVLVSGFERRLERFQTDSDAATQLITTGDSSPDPSLDPGELAAYTSVASLVLNLDEAVTRE